MCRAVLTRTTKTVSRFDDTGRDLLTALHIEHRDFGKTRGTILKNFIQYNKTLKVQRYMYLYIRPMSVLHCTAQHIVSHYGAAIASNLRCLSS